jgi:hypothetical protein
MKTRMLYIVLSASVVFASWGGRLADLLSWSDGS